MDPVEVNLLLNYSAIKTQLSALGADFQSALKGLGTGSIDISKSVSTKGVVDNLKGDIEEGAKSSGLTLGSLFKAGGGGSWFSDEFKKEVGKVDIGKMITGQGMESMNWMPIVSKLFAPANLIAFFGAMAAFGVTSAIAQQNASATAVTSTNANATSGSISANTGTTQAVTNVIGATAGTTEAVSNMVAELQNYGLSATDASNVTTTLGQALSLTGGTMSDTFNAQFVEYLQSVGATTASSIDDVITGLKNASQAAGTLGGGITGIMSSTNAFALAAQTAGDSVDTIMQNVVAYGVRAAVSLQGAQSAINLLTTGLQGNNAQLNALIGSVQSIADGLKTNVNGEWDTMATKVGDLSKTQVGDLELASWGVTVPQAESLLLLAEHQIQIDKNTTTLGNFSGGVAAINTQFEDTLTVSQKIGVEWANITNGLATFFGGSTLTPFLDTLDLVNTIITGLPTALIDTADAIGTAGTWLQNSGLIPIFTVIDTVLQDLLTGGQNTLKSSSQTTNTDNSNKTANVTQNITVQASSTNAATVIQGALKGALSYVTSGIL